MAGGRGPTFRTGGVAGRRWTNFAGAAFIAALFVLAAAIGVAETGGEPDRAGAPDRAVEVRSSDQRSPTAEPTPEVQVAAAVSPISASVESPRTVASSWSAGPAPVAPAKPAAAPESESERLAAEANAAYGVRIAVEGQNWGASAAAQATNVAAVISAMDRLPDTVISAVVSGPGGQLTFVSNDQGRTLGGWQPYGGHAMTYYTNSDHGPDGYAASSQVVLGVGAGTLSIGHEILHAYQSREVGPDQYALALLQPEMRSFMAAVGWRQVGSDEQVRAAASQPWSVLDELYVYEGRPLTYSNGNGAATMTAANPFEAFAIAGSFYYTRPSWMAQPDWPEYWAWFDANVG